MLVNNQYRHVIPSVMMTIPTSALTHIFPYSYDVEKVLLLKE